MKACCAALLVSFLAAVLPAETPAVPVRADRELLERIYENPDFSYSHGIHYFDYVRFRLQNAWISLMRNFQIPPQVLAAASAIRIVVYLLIVLLMGWLVYLFVKPWMRPRRVGEDGIRESALPTYSFREAYRRALSEKRYRDALQLYVNHLIRKLAERRSDIKPVMTFRECVSAMGRDWLSGTCLPEVEETLYGKKEVTGDAVMVLIAKLKEGPE